MGKALARVLLWALVVIAWALVVIFGAAVFFGGDLLTRVVGLVVALISVGIALLARRGLRIIQPPPGPPPPPPELIHLPENLDGGPVVLPGVGVWKHHRALTIDRDGFDAMRLLGKVKHFSWNEVESFGEVEIRIATANTIAYPARIQTTGFKRVGAPTLGQRIGRWYADSDEILPMVPVDRAELVAAMERYRRMYSAVIN